MKISDNQIVEPSVIIDKLVDRGVDAIFFVETQLKFHLQSLHKALKNATFCMVVKSKGKNNLLRDVKERGQIEDLTLW